MDQLERAYGKLLEAFALVACALIFGMTLMICADVFLRNVRIVPGMVGIEWANEISEGMLYVITMLTAPWLLRRGQHIRVDIVLRALPPRAAGFVFLFSELATLVFACFALYFSMQTLMTMVRFDALSPALMDAIATHTAAAERKLTARL